MGKSRASVFDVIITGWGVVVLLSRLKWKIASHTLENASAVSRVQPAHKHLPRYPHFLIRVHQGVLGCLAEEPFPVQILWSGSSVSEICNGALLFHPPIEQL